MCILIQVYKVLFVIALNLIAMKLRLLALALLSASLADPSAALAQPVTPVSSINAGSLKPVAQVEGISEYRLPNGLRVLLAPDASKPTTTVNITYLVGSRHESYGETGMAHLLEHLVFKGTPTRGNIMQELGKRGISFNGTTFYDRTNYYQTCPYPPLWGVPRGSDPPFRGYPPRPPKKSIFWGGFGPVFGGVLDPFFGSFFGPDFGPVFGGVLDPFLGGFLGSFFDTFSGPPFMGGPDPPFGGSGGV